MDVILYPGAKLCWAWFKIWIVDVEMEDLSMRNASVLGPLSLIANSLAYLAIIAMALYAFRERRVLLRIIILLVGVLSVLYGGLWGYGSLYDSELNGYDLAQRYPPLSPWNRLHHGDTFSATLFPLDKGRSIG